MTTETLYATAEAALAATEAKVYTHNVKRAAYRGCRCPECKTAYKAFKIARDEYRAAIKSITAAFEVAE